MIPLLSPWPKLCYKSKIYYRPRDTVPKHGGGKGAGYSILSRTIQYACVFMHTGCCSQPHSTDTKKKSLPGSWSICHLHYKICVQTLKVIDAWKEQGYLDSIMLNCITMQHCHSMTATLNGELWNKPVKLSMYQQKYHQNQMDKSACPITNVSLS